MRPNSLKIRYECENAKQDCVYFKENSAGSIYCKYEVQDGYCKSVGAQVDALIIKLREFLK